MSGVAIMLCVTLLAAVLLGASAAPATDEDPTADDYSFQMSPENIDQCYEPFSFTVISKE